MSPKAPLPQTFDLPRDWPLIQEAIGHGMRASLAHVTEEQLPGAVALLLVRIAFAQIVHGLVREELEALAVEVTS